MPSRNKFGFSNEHVAFTFDNLREKPNDMLNEAVEENINTINIFDEVSPENRSFQNIEKHKIRENKKFVEVRPKQNRTQGSHYKIKRNYDKYFSYKPNFIEVHRKNAGKMIRCKSAHPKQLSKREEMLKKESIKAIQRIKRKLMIGDID